MMSLVLQPTTLVGLYLLALCYVRDTLSAVDATHIPAKKYLMPLFYNP